jgi:PAS domain S-box-containing protein
MTTPKLFLRFALYSGIALVAAVAIGLLLARWNANDRAQSRAIGEATAVATQLGRDDLARTAFQWPRPSGGSGSDLTDFLDDFFSPTTAGHEPAKVVLYSPQGYVTYATDRSLIGTQTLDAGRVHDALSGPRYAVADGRQQAYVPVTWTFASGTASGVMRLDHDYAPIAAEIHDDFLFQAGVIALALFGLYLAMLPIMRRVTRSLRRSYVERAQLAAIVDHSNDAIIGQTPDGVITSWNAGAQAVYGWTADQALGKSIDILLPEHRPVHRASDLDLARTTHVRKDGAPVTVSVTVSPIRDEQGAFIGSSMIARDVTELNRLEQELREAHRQEAVGRLAGGLAHDFGEVLGAIENAATNLLIESELGERALRDLEKIRRATAQGSSLADQLLAVGGVQEANPELLDLNAAVEAARSDLQALAGPHVEIATDLDPELGQVHADRDQIEQLILNLAANARDSMPVGGRITIKTQNVDFSRRSRADDQGHHVMFAVSDTGSGLSDETTKRPFEPFFRRSESGERMALGLAAVCGIVKQSGGTMGVESRPQGGSVIRVYLPRVGVEQRATADV